jgi:hypothetical protein
MFVEGAHHYLRQLKTADVDRRNGDELTHIAVSDLDLSPSRVGPIIAERIADVLISLGGRRQAGVVEDDVVAKESFPEETQEEILELLPIEGERGREFCQVLLDELKAYLKGGGVIAGRWGRVAVRDTGEVALVDIQPLRRRPARSRPKNEAIDL